MRRSSVRRRCSVCGCRPTVCRRRSRRRRVRRRNRRRRTVRRRAPPQRDGEQQTQAPPRGEQPSGALEGEPTEFRINGVLWKRTKSGDGYLADVDAAQYGGATRLLLKRGKDGKGYGACCFDENGPMKQVGWHNGDTAKAAIAGLESGPRFCAVLMLKALDLFCGAGGVAVGLRAAGYDVTGVDNADQPDYPGRFILGDVMDLVSVGIDLADYDLVWASPPCQAYSSMTWARRKEVGWRSIPPTRQLLAPHPVTIIENVWGAASTGDLRADVVLDYQMFRRLDPPFQRRRIFEVSFPPPDPPECRPWSDYPPAIISPCTRDMRGYRERRQELGLPPQTIYDLRAAFRADWIYDKSESPDGRHSDTYFRNAVGNLVPPEYAEWLGRRAADHIAGRHYDRQPPPLLGGRPMEKYWKPYTQRHRDRLAWVAKGKCPMCKQVKAADDREHINCADCRQKEMQRLRRRKAVAV